MKKPKPPCILYVSTFPPRECGIATFTQDLTNAMDKEFNPGIKSKILAINDNGTSIYNYPRKVIMQINETEMEDYLNRANEINRSPDIKVVNIQHEYGIFGGDWGDYLLPFLELLQKPVITTMHTVLPDPPERLKRITKAIINKSAGIVVMTKHSARLLEEEYGVSKSKITIIPHGVHHIAYPSKSRAKRKLNLSGHFVISTFGMINRDKGIEYAIEALPKIVKEFPNVLYLIIGATHPVVRRHEGEIYRNKLKKLILKLGLKDNVKFYNKYLSLKELIDFLKATDAYISPTLNPLQAVSGTVSYALSCACPIIATANQYAQDVISPECGVLVHFRNSRDIKRALFDMLTDKKMRKEMQRNSYFYSRHMTWQNVALSYFKLFNNFAKIVPRDKDKLPPIKLDYIKRLTDNFGIIQFARHTRPDIHSGYCLDDNARALIVCAQVYQNKKNKSTLALIETYLRFIKFSQKPNGKFNNFINYTHEFNGRDESEDSFGRAIWALGYVLSCNRLPEDIKKEAHKILNKSLKTTPRLISLRAIAFTILGLTYLLEKKCKSKYLNLLNKLAGKLSYIYTRQAQKEKERPPKERWLWFEDYLTYSNYKLPEALFRAALVTGNNDYLKIAEESTEFLSRITFEKEDYFSPIGQDGWYFRNGKRAYFDQQPEDTASAVEAFVAAYLATKKEKYKERAKFCFDWFLGKNHLNQMVYDEATGGCYDGLGKYSLNFNQGAESTISYWLARLAIEKIYS